MCWHLHLCLWQDVVFLRSPEFSTRVDDSADSLSHMAFNEWRADSGQWAAGSGWWTVEGGSSLGGWSVMWSLVQCLMQFTLLRVDFAHVMPLPAAANNNISCCYCK